MKNVELNLSNMQLLSLNVNKTKTRIIKHAETASCGLTIILCGGLHPKAQHGFDINQQ